VRKLIILTILNSKTFPKSFWFITRLSANWAFDIGYDRYAPGLMDIALVDKKCTSACPADCVDIRIFAGAKPTNTSNQLFIQLYENAIAVKDTNNPDLVQKLLLVIKPSIKF